MTQLEEEMRIGKAGALAAHLRRHELVVLDELGYLPFARSGGQLLFHLISKLYELTSDGYGLRQMLIHERVNHPESQLHNSL